MRFSGALTYPRAWLMQKSAPLTVHYGRALDVHGEGLPPASTFTVTTRHGKVRCTLQLPSDVARPPVLVHLHGGAFIMRHPRMDDFWTRCVAARAGVATVSVDYDTAPQARYPVAQEQAYDVLEHLARHGHELGVDGDRIGVSGFSAGGNLAAAAALQARDGGVIGPRFLLLGVPSLDVTQTWSEKRPHGAPMLTPGILDLVRATYFRDASRRSEPLASPLLADSLAGLPPTLVITAERDVLRREGDAFADRLAREGTPVEHLVVPDRDHYFLDAANAGTLLPRMTAAVRKAL